MSNSGFKDRLEVDKLKMPDFCGKVSMISSFQSSASQFWLNPELPGSFSNLLTHGPFPQRFRFNWSEVRPGINFFKFY